MTGPKVSRDLTYPQGLAGLRHTAEKDRVPFLQADEVLPPLEVDLDALQRRIVPETPALPFAPRLTLAEKRLGLAHEFSGQSELLLLHALLIAVLRRDDPPKLAQHLFARLWTEKSEFLCKTLDSRWLVSAITTFGDHGATEMQRRTGHAVFIVFGLMKLYESERQFSGLGSAETFPLGNRSQKPLPLGLTPYVLQGGEVDRLVIYRVWKDAEGDATIGPLCRELFDRLNAADDTVFRRIRKMRMASRQKPTNAVQPVSAAVESASLLRRGLRFAKRKLRGVLGS